MANEIFSIPSQGFTVFRSEDGAISWSGGYQGMKVVAASPIAHGRCIILLDRDASKEKVFENLLCIEHSGQVAWKAELPDQPDSFVEFEATANSLIAWTWSCWMMRLDPATGKTIERKFVK